MSELDIKQLSMSFFVILLLDAYKNKNILEDMEDVLANLNYPLDDNLYKAFIIMKTKYVTISIDETTFDSIIEKISNLIKSSGFKDFNQILQVFNNPKNSKGTIMVSEIMKDIENLIGNDNETVDIFINDEEREHFIDTLQSEFEDSEVTEFSILDNDVNKLH